MFLLVVFFTTSAFCNFRDPCGILYFEFHRESSLYLPQRFSQLSTEIRGDVPFPQGGPHKITRISTQIEKFRRFAEEDSCFSIVKVMNHGLRFDGFTRRFADSSPSTVAEEGVMPFFQG